MPYQSDWRRCSSCSLLFYNGSPDQGACPSGGRHDGIMDIDYCVPYNTSETLRAQGEWRNCKKCHNMFYNGDSVKGLCTSGGEHHAGNATFNFTLPYDVDDSGFAEPDWHNCVKCHSLFFDGDGNDGVCEGGGAHRSRGRRMFVLPHDIPPQLSFNWSPITYSNEDPVGGWARLTIRRDGSFTWSGHFRENGFTSYEVSIAWGMKDSQGHLYGFRDTGRTDGTVEANSQHYTWHITGANASIADRWAFIAAGNTSHGSAHSGIHAGGIIEAIKNALRPIRTTISVV